MKGLVKVEAGSGHLALLDVPEKHAGGREVRIRVRGAALCGTDVLIGQGLRDVAVPVVLGHEFSGTVDEVGEGVADVRVGDRVTTETDAYVCGTCVSCRAGEVNLCERRRAIGQTVDGGFAEFAVVPARGVHSLPDTVDFVAGALTEPLAVAVHAVVERAHVQPEEWVAVIGPGTIGLLAAQVAQAIGARVTLAGLARHSDRFRLGQELGIASVIQLNHPGDVEAMRDAAREEGSFGVDVVVDCSGAPEGLMDSLRLVRKGGRVVLVGFYGKPLEIDADKIINAELSLIASRGKRPSSFRIALDLLRDRRVNTSKLVTHRFALAAWQDALAVAGRSGTKVVFDDMIA